MTARLPLEGVRVLAVEQYGAGPYGSMLLAELGAEVIKIEHPAGGDVGRSTGPDAADGDSLFFESLNRNKRSLALDLRRAEGRRVFDDLVSVSDAVYSNLRGDVPDKLGLSYDKLSTLNARVVCCALTGYGRTGPKSAEPGFDYMVQGLAGWMSLTGDLDGPPAKSGLSVVDFSAGIAAALALVACVLRARETGVGGDCDVSLLSAALSMLKYQATWHLTAGFKPERVAQSGHPTVVPFGCFPTADGWIVAGGSKEKFWSRLAGAVGRPDLADDERFRTPMLRLRHRAELTGLLNDVFRTRDTSTWLQQLAAAGVPCAPVNSVAEALRDEQVVATGAVFSVEHPRLGPVFHVAGPILVDDTVGPRGPAPGLNEGADDLLPHLLGYDEAHLLALHASGALGSGPAT